MNYTDLVVKFNTGDSLSDEELFELYHYASDIVAVLAGHGLLTKCLNDHALNIRNRTEDIIRARKLV